MALLSDKDRSFLQNHLAQTLEEPVKLVLFTQTIITEAVPCQFCRETEQILQEVAELSEKVSVEVHSFATDKELAQQYGIDKIPATIVMRDGTDYGVRFFGIPSGYEFTSLIEDIVDVSRGRAELAESTLELLSALPEPVHIQVFVTPTCPYCPAAVRLAHSLAIASDKVRADMVEAVEFPHLANKYGVYGVPRTIINEETHLEGAAPEPLFVAKVLQAVGLLSEEELEEIMQNLGVEEEGAQTQEFAPDGEE